MSTASPEPSTPPLLSRRERARAATVEEIKATARRLMHESGSTDVRFADIAREMGMTAPALYRYFADADELLTALIVDAFDDLGETVAEARDQFPPDNPSSRLLAVGQAYREWARREPQRFALILGMPVPGFCPPEEGPTTEAADRAMTQLKSLFYDAARLGVLGPPLLREVHPAVQECVLGELADKHEDDDPPLPAESFQALMHCWSILHGFTCLEAYGHLDFLPQDARDGLFTGIGHLVIKASGLPEPG